MAGDVVIRVVSGGGVATLVLATVAVVLSLLSLAWQAASFFLSGSRIRLEAQRGMRIGPMFNYFVPGDISPLRLDEGDTEELVIVTARNVGRLAATIVNCQVLAGGGGGLGVPHPPSPLARPLPQRLEPHSQAEWFFPADTLRGLALFGLREVTPTPAVTQITVEVRLGSGKLRRATVPLPMEPSPYPNQLQEGSRDRDDEQGRGVDS